MKNTSIQVEEAIRVASFMLSKKVSPVMVSKSLTLEGFTPNKANVIVRWAQRLNEVAASELLSEEEFQAILNKSKNDSKSPPPESA